MLTVLARLRNRHLFFLDLLLLPLAVYSAFVLRLERFDIAPYWPALFLFAAVVLVVLPLTFHFTGVYSRYWRYASIEELLLLTGSVTTGVFLAGASTIVISLIFPEQLLFFRSVPFIFLPLALMATTGTRFLIRAFSGQRLTVGAEDRKLVLIMGAGDAGQMLARDIRENPGRGLQVVGFVDDDPQKQDLTVRGLPIFGGRKDIPRLVERTGIDEVLIAMPSVPSVAVREIVTICEEAGVRARILPSLSELLTDEMGLRHLRPIELSDLLRRDPIETNLTAVHDLVRGKTVLVTGAGGSIGSEICRQVAKAQPASLILLGHGENSIFNIQNELRREFAKGHITLKAIHPIIADVRDSARLEQVFSDHQPQVVFHAAAHKHVPLMEANPADAITNNILGAHALLEVCLANEVENFVLISTDKAVNPANIMGMTKRMAELLVLDAAHRSGRSYVAVRFGNVLGSRGSVVPFFKQQIEAGGPVTVTHRHVTRYFMTIPEAVQLVLQAATLGHAGEIFMLDMGQPMKIVDLARDLIRLSGLRPDEDIKIVFTGLRPGEKLHEELYQGHETHAPTEHEKILRVTSDFQQPPELLAAMPQLRQFARSGQIDEALALIAALVPEYTPPAGIEPRPLSATPAGIELDF